MIVETIKGKNLTKKQIREAERKLGAYPDKTDAELLKIFYDTKELNGNKILKCDTEIRKELVRRNQKLAILVVKKYFKKFFEFEEDLIQEACIGLYRSVDGFDPNMGFQFTTYANYCIKQACVRYVNNQDMIYVPYAYKKDRSVILKSILKGEIDCTQTDIQKLLQCKDTKAQYMFDVVRATNVFSLEEISQTTGSQLEWEQLTTSLVDMDTKEQLENKKPSNVLVSTLMDIINNELAEEERYAFIARYGIEKDASK